MKSTIKDELTIPQQTRYLVGIDLGRVERHVNYALFLLAILFHLNVFCKGLRPEPGISLTRIGVGCSRCGGFCRMGDWYSVVKVLASKTPRTYVHILRWIRQLFLPLYLTNSAYDDSTGWAVAEETGGQVDKTWCSWNLSEMSWMQCETKIGATWWMIGRLRYGGQTQCRKSVMTSFDQVQILTRRAQLQQHDNQDHIRYQHALETLLVAEKEADKLIEETSRPSLHPDPWREKEKFWRRKLLLCENPETKKLSSE